MLITQRILGHARQHHKIDPGYLVQTGVLLQHRSEVGRIEESSVLIQGRLSKVFCSAPKLAGRSAAVGI